MSRPRRRYDDKFRASAVVMLEAAGYPGKEGALMEVSRHLGMPHNTLRAWYHDEHNSVPTELLQEFRENVPDEWSNLARKSYIRNWGGFGKLDSKERYVYLVREEFKGLIKIGIASDLTARLASMQAGCPQTLNLIGYIKTSDARRIENHIHNRYSDKVYRGEWFELSPTDIQTILDYNNGVYLLEVTAMREMVSNESEV